MSTSNEPDVVVPFNISPDLIVFNLSAICLPAEGSESDLIPFFCAFTVSQ